MESERKRYYKNKGMALRVENSISGERLLTRVPFPPLNKELLLLQTFLGEERERRERKKRENLLCLQQTRMWRRKRDRQRRQNNLHKYIFYFLKN